MFYMYIVVIYKSKNTGDDSFPTEESRTEEAFRYIRTLYFYNGCDIQEIQKRRIRKHTCCTRNTPVI